MNTESTLPWFPLFEFQDFLYQSFLVLPTDAETAAAPGSAVNARKWAKGEFLCGQAFVDGGGEKYSLKATLQFAPNVELAVSITGDQGLGHAPGTFEGTGTGMDGPLKGTVYAITGWVFPEEPVTNQAARVLRVCGSVQAVRGTDANPGAEPGGMPVGNVVA
jgi:hypothetical protein